MWGLVGRVGLKPDLRGAVGWHPPYSPLQTTDEPKTQTFCFGS